ncbi:MAG: tetratricopeptide repeat protein [Rubrivivax sp.]
MSAPQTLLMCDLVDSTGITQRLGDEAAQSLWAAHDRMSRELLQAWKGLEIDRSDGFLLLFPLAADAAGFALDYHRRLSGLAEPVTARVALHTAVVELRRNPAEDVARGAKSLEITNWMAKATAARVMSLARGGQTLASDSATLALRDSGLRLRSHGHWRLQGLTEPMEVFEVGDEETGFAPPVDAPKAWRVVHRQGVWRPLRDMRHTLPAERNDFVGRHAELQRLAQLIDGPARLVTVHGPGGVGKTRLVQRFAWIWMGDFPGGVWFCDLAQATSADGIAYAVAQGLDMAVGGADPIHRIGDAIAARGRCLVVLDNFEQVVPLAEATLGAWLDRASEACFVATSREVLGIVGEVVQALDPLPPADGSALFMLRIESVRPGSIDAPEDARAVGTLVQMLDGLPLAIELAAARVRAMSPANLLARMSHRFEVLTSRGGRRDRQATLRATFDWSWDLLSGAEKRALARLSVFSGSFDMEAAAHVMAVPEGQEDYELLQALVEKSLLRPLAGSRFELLTSVREYAAERLSTPDSFPASGAEGAREAEIRHEEHFVGLDAARIERNAGLDLDNLVLACRRAAARGAVRSAARALEGAWAALKLRGPFRAGIELADLVSRIEGIDSAASATAHAMAGLALQACGRTTAARERLERSLLESRDAGDRLREASTMASLAEIHLQVGEVESAEGLFTRTLEMARAIGAPIVECGVLNGLGTLNENLGRLDLAGTHYKLALKLARDIGHRRWEGGALGNLGQLRANQGRVGEARDAYEAGLSIARELGDRQWEGNTLCNLGLLDFTTGRLESARSLLLSSLAIAREIGHRRLECVVQCNLGLMSDSVGDFTDAGIRLGSSLDIARALNDRRSEGQVLGYLALVLARESKFSDARRSAELARRLLTQVSDRLSLGVVACIEVQLECLAGNIAAAFTAYESATALVREMQPGPESELGQALVKASKVLPPQPG